MSLIGLVKENKVVLPEGISLPEGTAVELLVIDKDKLEPSEEVKLRFWELIGIGDSGESDVSTTNKHRYLSEALDERPGE